MKSLKIADNLKLPLEAVTETFGILAVRGAGKSNAGAVMAEEMYRAKLPFVVIDPVRAWYGLRSSRDGRSPGLAVPIFGGRHGDVPLDRDAGVPIADLVAEQRLSCVIDISDFESEAARKHFLLDFARRLYQKNQDPLHLFLEEADDYIPQRPMRDEARLLRAWENIVRRGRSRGLGCTIITQRSASVNKNVLTQVQTLIALRTTGPQDRAAIEDWLKYHHQGREIMESLPELENGEAWVWSPHFLRKTVRVRFRMRNTFDSGATPSARKARRAPTTLADVDLDAVKTKIAATIEKAKANDPTALRAELACLRNQIEVVKRTEAVKAKTPKVVQVPILGTKDLNRLEKLIERAEKMTGSLVLQIDGMLRKLKGGEYEKVTKAIHEIAVKLEREKTHPAQLIVKESRRDDTFPGPGELIVGRSEPYPPVKGIRIRPQLTAGTTSNGSLGKGERAVLIAIAQDGGTVTKPQITVVTGYARSSRDTYLQKLSQRLYIKRVVSGFMATQAGIDALGSDYQPLPTGDALREFWLNNLSRGEKAVLQNLIDIYPMPMDREKLSAETGYARSSRDTYLQKLAARKLIESVEQGQVKASDLLFT